MKKTLFLMLLVLALGACTNHKNNPTLKAKVKNYTNSDWLFKHFLGDHGVPDSLKAFIEPDLQRVANGFALQYAKGEDVGKNIDAAEKWVQGMRAAGMLDPAKIVKSFEHDKAGFKANPKQLAPYPSEDEKLVEKYHLPYAMKGAPHKITNLTAEMVEIFEGKRSK